MGKPSLQQGDCRDYNDPRDYGDLFGMTTDKRQPPQMVGVKEDWQ
jgi:hypothetical protein